MAIAYRKFGAPKAYSLIFVLFVLFVVSRPSCTSETISERRGAEHEGLDALGYRNIWWYDTGSKSL